MKPDILHAQVEVQGLNCRGKKYQVQDERTKYHYFKYECQENFDKMQQVSLKFPNHNEKDYTRKPHETLIHDTKPLPSVSSIS